MKRILCGALTAWLACVLVSCGGGTGDSVDARPFSPPSNIVPAPTITGLLGLVVDSTNGTAVSGVTVTAGALSTITDTQGNFALPTIPNGSNVVSFTLNTYAPQSRTVQISSTIETSLIVQIVPNGALDPFDPATGGTLTVAGSTGQIDIPGNSLRRADGSAPSAGPASALLTPIGPSLDAFLLPSKCNGRRSTADACRTGVSDPATPGAKHWGKEMGSGGSAREGDAIVGMTKMRSPDSQIEGRPILPAPLHVLVHRRAMLF